MKPLAALLRRLWPAPPAPPAPPALSVGRWTPHPIRCPACTRPLEDGDDVLLLDRRPLGHLRCLLVVERADGSRVGPAPSSLTVSVPEAALAALGVRLIERADGDANANAHPGRESS